MFQSKYTFNPLESPLKYTFSAIALLLKLAIFLWSANIIGTHSRLAPLNHKRKITDHQKITMYKRDLKMTTLLHL